MKVAQNDETDPDKQPVRPPCIPSIANTQLSPSGSFVRKRETPGILSRMFPPFVGITSYCVRALLAPLLVMSCIDMHLFALYLLFLPPFSRQTPRPTPLLPSTTTVLTTTLSCQSNQASPPLITRYRLLYSLYCLHQISVACYCFPLILFCCIACLCHYCCYLYLQS